MLPRFFDAFAYCLMAMMMREHVTRFCVLFFFFSPAFFHYYVFLTRRRLLFFAAITPPTFSRPPLSTYAIAYAIIIITFIMIIVYYAIIIIIVERRFSPSVWCCLLCWCLFRCVWWERVILMQRMPLSDAVIASVIDVKMILFDFLRRCLLMPRYTPMLMMPPLFDIMIALFW